MAQETTTVRVKRATKDRLAKYHQPEHDNLSQTIDALIEWTPDPSAITEGGCAVCETAPPADVPLEELSGIVQHFVADDSAGNTVSGHNWFCSADCVSEFQEQIDHQFPREPDAVTVGGADTPQTRLEADLEFLLSEDTPEVTLLNIPGAFPGSRYRGEPVYVEHNNEIVNEGVIREVFHEETRTTLTLDYDIATARLHHPNENVRAEYLSDWRVGEHTECGETAVIGDPDDPPFTCPSCSDSFDWNEWSEHPVSAEFRQ